jgi:predicted alpha/beta superfamily hydrolase
MNFRLLLMALLLIGCTSQNPVPIEEDASTFTINSEILNETREMLVSIPKHELSDKIAPQRFPVIFVLDGEDMFEYVKGMVNFLSLTKGNDVLPKSIVIGIKNTNRTRDLTPNPIEGTADAGGAQSFLGFMEKELIPYVQKNYPTIDHNTLIGHSYGGLFTLFALQQRPDLFDNYIALDPSYILLRDKNMAFDTPPYKGKQLFVGIANTLDPGMDSSNYEVNWNTEHFHQLITWTKELAAATDMNLRAWSKYYAEDSHASLCVAATHDALRTLFSWYHLDTAKLRQNPDNKMDIKKKIEDHFKMVSDRFGEQVLPDELLVHSVAWNNFRLDPELTGSLLKLNLSNHPDSFLANAAIGRFYKFTGNIDSAAWYFEKALVIQDDEPTRQQLKEIIE